VKRRFEKVQTAFGEITMTLGLLAGEVFQITPQLESCRAASKRMQQQTRLIYPAALAACPKTWSY
jgi:uncharacterized protein (DUF111 family)